MRPRVKDPLTLAIGLAAALPVLVATAHAVAIDWTPVGDRAVIVVRALDVLSTHPPLLGQYSASSQILGEAVHSPGPMLYWLLALPARLGSLAPALTMGLVNAAAVVLTIFLARRRGGVGLMVGAGAGLALVLASLEPSLPYDIWNPSVALLPFALTLFLAWSLACGEWRWLPLLAIVGSFSVQAHLGYAPPTLLVLAVALGFLLASRPAIPRRWVLATLAIVAVCWIAPLAESIVHRPGNFEQIVRSGLREKATFGSSAGVHAVERAVGVPPWWLDPPQDALRRVADVTFAPPAGITISALAILLALAGLTVLAGMRGRRELAAGGAIALALVPAMVLVTSSTPTQGLLFATVGYSLRWTHVAGMFIWLMTAFLALRLAWPAARLEGRFAAPAGAAIVAAVALAVALTRGEDPAKGAYPLAHQLTSDVRANAPPGKVVFVTGTKASVSFELQGASVLALRELGGPRPVTTLPGVGSPYNPIENPHDNVLFIAENRRPPRGRVIDRWLVSGVPGDRPPSQTRNRRVTVVLTP